MRFAISQAAASDCVLLQIDVNDVQQRTTRRGSSKIRLKGGERVQVIVRRNVIWKVRSPYRITESAAAAAKRCNVDAALMLRVLATPRTTGGVHVRDGIVVTVASIVGGELIQAVRRVPTPAELAPAPR